MLKFDEALGEVYRYKDMASFLIVRRSDTVIDDLSVW